MNAFHVCGSLFAAWAVVLAVVGITREDFPRSIAVARVIGAISVVLAAAAIFSAIYVGVTEKKHEGASGENSSALPRL